MIVTILTALSAAVVLMRVICLVAHLDRSKWAGQQYQYAALTSGHALLGGGAVAAVILPAWSPFLLLVGAALMIIADRRRPV